MQTRSLHEDLLAIDGVEGAEVDAESGSPSGLRIRIAHGADQQFVGEQIRRVLSAHSLGTDTRLPGEPAPDTMSRRSMATVSELAAQSADPAPAETLVTLADEPDTIIDLATEVSRDPLGSSVSEPAHDAHGSVSRIEMVSVEEGRAGILVTVAASDGSVSTERARASEGGVESAVVLAAARLAAPGSPDPIVVEIDERRVDGVDIIMIVLDKNGVLAAGSAVVGAGRAFALGRATWAAVAN